MKQREKTPDDVVEWRQTKKWVPEEADFDASDQSEIDSLYLVQEYWAPKGKKWPLWHVGIIHASDENDFSKSKGYKISVSRKDSKNGWWQDGGNLLNVPCFFMHRIADLIQKLIPKESS